MDERLDPVEEGSRDATTAEKLSGLVEQMRGDVRTDSIASGQTIRVLRERLYDSRIWLSQSEFASLVERLDAALTEESSRRSPAVFHRGREGHRSRISPS
jgi:hypothetical protein